LEHGGLSRHAHRRLAQPWGDALWTFVAAGSRYLLTPIKQPSLARPQPSRFRRHWSLAPGTVFF
jgi:hypothetical protein